MSHGVSKSLLVCLMQIYPLQALVLYLYRAHCNKHVDMLVN